MPKASYAGITKENMSADFKEALKIDPENEEVYYLRGLAKLNLKDKSGACADWNKAAALGSKEGARKQRKNIAGSNNFNNNLVILGVAGRVVATCHEESYTPRMTDTDSV